MPDEAVKNANGSSNVFGSRGWARQDAPGGYQTYGASLPRAVSTADSAGHVTVTSGMHDCRNASTQASTSARASGPPLYRLAASQTPRPLTVAVQVPSPSGFPPPRCR